MKAYSAYAYSPREKTANPGRNHVMIAEDEVRIGRIVRKRGQTLCGKRFWGLDGGRDAEELRRYGCTRCMEIAQRLNAINSIFIIERELRTIDGKTDWHDVLVPLFPVETNETERLT